MLRLQDLRLSTKFVLIALLFATPVVLLGFLYVQQSLKDVRFANRERAGAAYLIEAWPAYQAALAGRDPGADEMRQLETAGNSYDALMSTTAAREAFLAAPAGLPRVEAGQTFIQRVADGSWLTLDPDLDSYYLMEITTVQLPDLEAATRTLLDVASRALADPSESPANVTSALGRVNRGIRSLLDSYDTAFAGNPDGTVRARLDVLTRATLSRTQQFSGGIDALLASTQAASRSATLSREHAAVQAQLDELWRSSRNEMDLLLKHRATRLRRQQMLNLGISLALLVAVVGLMIAVSRSVTRRLSTVATAMNDMRGGRLDRHVPHQDGRDEIGDIARTLEVFRERLLSLRAFEGDLIAQETNKAAESRFRDMLNVSPIGALIVTQAGEPLYCNAGFAEIIGSTNDRVMSRNISTVWKDPEQRRALMRRLEGQEKVRDLETILQREDGSAAVCLLSGEPVEYEGEAAALRWVYDITERKKAEADIQLAQSRLLQSEKLASLGQLTAGIAHEIKNPLNFVNNFSDLSKDLLKELNEVLAPAPLDEATREEVVSLSGMIADNLGKVVQHGKRADSIVKNMLLHSRGDQGERRAVDLNATVEESLNLAYHGARAEKPEFNVTLEKTFDPAVGRLDIFPQEFSRVLVNLINNGFYAVNKRRQAAGGDGYAPTLRVATRSFPDRVEILVRDNGTGIPDEVKAKMFTPFFTTKPPGEGTGLGLSLSHDIIAKQHGGAIDLQTRPGEFTEFTISLPRAAATQERLS